MITLIIALLIVIKFKLSEFPTLTAIKNESFDIITFELDQVKYKNSTLEALNVDLKNKLDLLSIECQGIKDSFLQSSSSMVEEHAQYVIH